MDSEYAFLVFYLQSNLAALHFAIHKCVAVALLLIADKRTDINLLDKVSDGPSMHFVTAPARQGESRPAPPCILSRDDIKVL